MGLGNLFSAIIKTTVELPVSIVADVLTGLPRTSEGKDLFSKGKIDEIADELNKITK